MKLRKRFNKFKGRYYNLKNKIKKEKKLFQSKIKSSINAFVAVWVSQSNSASKKIEDFKRVENFFHFCKELEEHPFYSAHKDGGNFNINVNITSEQSTTELSFDDKHLESFLTRLRQVIFSNELFSVDELFVSGIFQDICRLKFYAAN